jgi:hypothetical protein
MSLPFRIDGTVVRLGSWFAVSFQRTLRVPDDGRSYPLPPGLGAFPVVPTADLRDRLPAGWTDDGVVVPISRREALWVAFLTPQWHPCAVKVGVGGVDALTGGTWDPGLHDDPQDYLVTPHQPWLDGFKTGAGIVRQFVAVPLGSGDTVEGQVSGRETPEALRLVAYEPRPGLFPDQAPPPPSGPVAMSAPPPSGASGMAAGGTIRQKIYPDPHGIRTWDTGRRGEFVVYLVDGRRFEELTGRPAPPSPVSARTYAQYGFPWFDLDDEGRDDLAASETLAGVRSARQRDEARGEGPGEDDRSVPIDPATVQILRPPTVPPRQGE